MARRFSVAMWMSTALLSCTLLAAPALSQDEAAKDVPTPTPSANQDVSSDSQPTPDADAAEAAFQAKFAQWKALIVQLRQLRSDFQTTEDLLQRAAMSKQWDEIVLRGEDMLPDLIDTVLVAYRHDSSQDRVKTNFLVKVLADYLARDIYEPALKIGNELLDQGCDDPKVFHDTGIAAFALNDYQRTSELLGMAAKLNALTGDVIALQAPLEDYKKYWKKEQELRAKEVEADDLPRVRLTTTQGDIVVELYENEAPDTVGNFISLVKRGFYDDLTFHRVIAGFMAQCGCPEGDGTGGPGYTIYDECGKPGFRRHFRGVLSMAKTNAPDSGGSQFFITFRPTPYLDGKHTVFGRVIEGIDVLAKLKRSGSEEAKTIIDPDKIVKAEVLRDRGHEYLPHKVE